MSIATWMGASAVKFCSDEGCPNHEERVPIGAELHTKAWVSRVGDDPSTMTISRREETVKVLDRDKVCEICGKPNTIDDFRDGSGYPIKSWPQPTISYDPRALRQVDEILPEPPPPPPVPSEERVTALEGQVATLESQVAHLRGRRR
jgi:hypothetical protein